MNPHLLSTPTQEVVLVPESKFEPYDVPGNAREHRYLDLNPGGNCRESIIIAPHHNEAWINIQLFQFAQDCRAKGRRLISIGHENQLPFFSMFSDAVILQRGGNLLSLMQGASDFGTDTAGFSRLKGWTDIYRLCDSGDNPWRKSVSEIVAQYSSFSVVIREESFGAYNRLQLPERFIWCEVKHGCFDWLMREIEGVDCGIPLLGMDKRFQMDLIRNHGAHFMAIQILSSLLGDARFFCGAGSGHVFGVAPVNIGICLGTDRFFTMEANEAIRRINLNRFGVVPFIFADLQWAAQDFRCRPWSIDYIANRKFCKDWLSYLARAEKVRNVDVVNWNDFVGRNARAISLRGKVFSFERANGPRIRSLKLNQDGTLSPSGRNESFWKATGNRLTFFGECGQPSTIFEEVNGKWEGVFLYNPGILHILREEKMHEER